ncbi:PucR family transcriptional regulator ligand-binding domain-containing protein, partial [Streptomyces sp. 8L]|uniref:PucR family transcriptional regulator ligand-binding domain-containing protein n=1 Tax=Streptomyces sp. 8L TaxID=2877242 RepID=UPI001CD604C5
MDARGGITVRRALDLPALRGGLPEVVAGAGHVDRTVRWVHAGEVPNMASLLKGGELLLTTGLGLGSRPAEQRAFVRRLADRGIAALVVELGPRFDRLPRTLVETARTAGLPLVQLHREVAFVSVTEEIHTEIVNGHYALLRQAEEVHGRCTRALLDGGGIPRVLRVLADFSAGPVFLETAQGRLLYAAAPEASSGAGTAAADPLAVWEGLRGGRADRRPSPPAGSVLVDVAGGTGGTGAVRARLVIPAVPAPLGPVHRLAAERAAGTLAVVLMQARQEEELAARGRGDFLTDLAEGRVSPEDAPRQAGVLGFRPGGGPLLPVVMRLAPEPAPSGNWAVLARAVLEELASVGVPVLLGVRPVEGRVPLLLGLRAQEDRTGVADRVAAALRAGVGRA